MSITLNDAGRRRPVAPRLPPTPALLDAVRNGAAIGDATGDLVPSHDRMLDEGLFHLLVPRELGGAGGTATDWFDAGLAISRADPSAGWIMTQGAVQNAWIAVSAAPSFSADFFAARRTIASSSAGQATAERNGDHFVVRNARWAYVSGSQGASYLGGMVRTTRPDGTPETRMVLVPAAEATIERSWDTHGLRGTGSHHVDLGESLIVPAVQTFLWPVLGNAVAGHAGRRGPPHAVDGLGVGRRSEPRRRSPGDRGSDRVGAGEAPPVRHRTGGPPVDVHPGGCRSRRTGRVGGRRTSPPAGRPVARRRRRRAARRRRSGLACGWPLPTLSTRVRTSCGRRSRWWGPTPCTAPIRSSAWPATWRCCGTTSWSARPRASSWARC